MNYYNFFALQLSTELELVCARTLEMNLRCLEKPEGFENKMKNQKRNFPERASVLDSDWYTSLVEAIRPYYIPCQDSRLVGVDDYENAFKGFMEASLKKLNGGRSVYLGNKNLNADNFSQDELEQPHMKWVKKLCERMIVISDKYSKDTRSHLRMAMIHPSLNVSDDILWSLNKDFMENWACTMSLPQYVNWYVESRSHFTDGTRSKLNEDISTSMKNTLKAWSGGTMANNTSWLARNYEFHPSDGAFLNQWVIDNTEDEAESTE